MPGPLVDLWLPHSIPRTFFCDFWAWDAVCRLFGPAMDHCHVEFAAFMALLWTIWPCYGPQNGEFAMDL